MSAPYACIKSTTPFIFFWLFLRATQMDVNNQIHKVNRIKTLHKIHNYLIVQRHFHRTNPIVHMKSRLHHTNTKHKSPYYLNYSYIINPTYSEEHSATAILLRFICCFCHLMRKRIARSVFTLNISSVYAEEQQSVCTDTLSISSSGTGWWTSWPIGYRHQTKHKSSTTS